MFQRGLEKNSNTHHKEQEQGKMRKEIVEHLLCKCKVLSSNSRPTKKKRKEIH
jgi:hypothetical protein